MYAESSDGLTWTKPALGVINDTRTVANTTDFAQNNIVVLDNTGTGVLVDTHAPPNGTVPSHGWFPVLPAPPPPSSLTVCACMDCVCLSRAL